MPRKFSRRAKKTVLIVGEGTTEPACIVRYAISSVANRAYDKVAILMDTDIEWSNQLQDDAKKKKIQLIGSKPCIEGLLLKILGEPVHEQSADCKSTCNRLFKSNSAFLCEK